MAEEFRARFLADLIGTTREYGASEYEQSELAMYGVRKIEYIGGKA